MPAKTAWYRLGNVLLLLLLAFIVAQVFDWTSGLSAGIDSGARADLAAVSPATIVMLPPDTLITQWGATINTPGNYVLGTNLQGKSGCAVSVHASGVKLSGEKRTITGDSAYEGADTDGREQGVCVGTGVSGVMVQGVVFQGLDYGVQGQSDGPTAEPVTIRNNRFHNPPDKGRGVNWWVKAPGGTLPLFNVLANYFGGGAYGVDISNYAAVGKVAVTDNTFDGAKTAYTYYSMRESSSSPAPFADTTDFARNEVSGGQTGVAGYFSSGSVQSFQVKDSSFDFVNYPVQISASSSSDTLNGVNIANNNISQARNPVFIGGYGMVRDAVISNNFIQGPGGQSAIDYPGIKIYGGGTDITVQANYFTGGSNLAGMYFTGGATNAPKPFFGLHILGNVIRNLMTPGARGIQFANIPDTTAVGASAANLAASPAAPLVRGNSFIGNAGPGITYTLGIVNPLPSIDAAGNWWGDPAGPNGPNGDGVGSNVTVTDWLTVEPQPVLAVTKTPAAAFIRPGEPLTYTIVVRNNGTGLAGDLHVVDQVTGADIVGHTGFAAVAGNRATWRRAVLAASEQLTYTLVVVAPAEGLIRNTVTVTAVQGASATTSVDILSTTRQPTFLPLVLRQ